MKQDDTHIHYNGRGPVEVGIGNYNRMFNQARTAVVEDSRVRAELRAMDGFYSGPAPEKSDDAADKGGKKK
ncbi:MAG: hypothetical protein JO314_11850 [Acidobacteria bacterium]|nr:hypothetical protein [Acidobacteriota bacterium]